MPHVAPAAGPRNLADMEKDANQAWVVVRVPISVTVSVGTVSSALGLQLLAYSGTATSGPVSSSSCVSV